MYLNDPSYIHCHQEISQAHTYSSETHRFRELVRVDTEDISVSVRDRSGSITKKHHNGVEGLGIMVEETIEMVSTVQVVCLMVQRLTPRTNPSQLVSGYFVWNGVFAYHIRILEVSLGIPFLSVRHG